MERTLAEKWLIELNKNDGKKIWRMCEEMYARDHRPEDRFFVNGEDFGDRLCGGEEWSYFHDIQSISVFRYVIMLHSFASWRPTQDIVCFDKPVYDSLINSAIAGEIPGDVMMRLPAWSVYVKTPYGFVINGNACEGFFITHYKPGSATLLFIYDDGELLGVMPVFVPLAGNILEGFIIKEGENGEVARESGDSYSRCYEGIVPKALSLVIYLCSYGFGDGRKYHDGSRTSFSSKKVKGEFKIFPPNAPTIRHPGSYFAEALERAERMCGEGSGERGPIRPHMRRAHWHNHRIGKGRVDVVAKWHLPVMVALGNAEKFEEA